MEILSSIIQDKMFMRTGIDQDQLDIIWANLNLDSDPEYIEMEKDYQNEL